MGKFIEFVGKAKAVYEDLTIRFGPKLWVGLGIVVLFAVIGIVSYC